MTESKQRRLDNAVAGVHQRYGPQALRRGDDFGVRRAPPHIPTGFSALDALTGCGGAPLGEITLFSGRSTSGKLTLGYKLLANAQRGGGSGGAAYTVGLLDLSRTADPDYVARCGVDLDYLLVGRPPTGRQAVELLGDLVQRHSLRVLVMDSLADLMAARETMGTLNARLPHLRQLLRMNHCALVILDEPRAPWLRWFNLDASRQVRGAAALHIEMQREQWLRQGGDFAGYRAQARLLKSRWGQGGRSAPVEIIFNGTVKACETW